MTARGKAAQAVRAMPSATAPLQNLRTILSSRMLDGCSTRLPLLLLLRRVPARVPPNSPFLTRTSSFQETLCSSSQTRTKRVMYPHLARITSLACPLIPVHYQGSRFVIPRGGWLVQGSSPREDSASAVLYTCIYTRAGDENTRQGRSHHLIRPFFGIFPNKVSLFLSLAKSLSRVVPLDSLTLRALATSFFFLRP